jgi:hypothetical protein
MERNVARSEEGYVYKGGIGSACIASVYWTAIQRGTIILQRLVILLYYRL